MNELLDKINELHDQITSLRPLGRDTVLSLKDYYKIGLTWSSNAIEGNTLTESETKVVIEDGLTVSGKPLKDHFEAEGHARAYEWMYSLIDSKIISEEDILKLHRLFFVKIDEDNAGIYRKSRVFISGSEYPLPEPEKISDLMKVFFNEIKEIRETEHPVIAAGKIHLKFVFIHPFIDGNGRIARLLMNLILLQEDYTIVIIPPVLRHEYISSIESAHRQDTDFLRLICKCVYESQKDYIRLLTA